MSTTSADIGVLLKSRGAWLNGQSVVPPGKIAERLPLSRTIAAHYPVFERLRDRIRREGPIELSAVGEGVARRLADAAVETGMLAVAGGLLDETGPEARRYLSGGWLEELVAAAATAAGADEVICGAVVAWASGGHEGRNEIDVIARRRDRLTFVSCKATASRFDGEDGARDRLTAALHEADNLPDHFGAPGDRVVLVVTSDLVDEATRRARYGQLFGKAHALDVALVTLDGDLWGNLLRALARG